MEKVGLCLTEETCVVVSTARRNLAHELNGFEFMGVANALERRSTIQVSVPKTPDEKGLVRICSTTSLFYCPEGLVFGVFKLF